MPCATKRKATYHSDGWRSSFGGCRGAQRSDVFQDPLVGTFRLPSPMRVALYAKSLALVMLRSEGSEMLDFARGGSPLSCLLLFSPYEVPKSAKFSYRRFEMF